MMTMNFLSVYTQKIGSLETKPLTICALFFTGINFTCFSFIYEDPCKFEKTAYDMVRSCD